MPTEIIESKEIYRGLIALRLATLRLADGALSREIIEHGKAVAVLPYDARRGAVMFGLARVGLSMSKMRTAQIDDLCSLPHENRLLHRRPVTESSKALCRRVGYLLGDGKTDRIRPSAIWCSPLYQGLLRKTAPSACDRMAGRRVQGE
jgi:hypothetical protein